MKITGIGKVLAAAALLTAVVVAGYFSQTPSRLPAAPPPAAGPSAPPAAVSTEPTGTPPAAVPGRQTGQLRLAPPAAKPVGEPASGFASSMKKESERVILPGVTVNSSGQGVSVQLPKKDETLQLRKNPSETSDYQMMWQKKF